MFDTIGALLLHILVAHAVVVLLPLAVLGSVAVALRPRWRAGYSGPNALVAVVGTPLPGRHEQRRSPRAPGG